MELIWHLCHDCKIDNDLRLHEMYIIWEKSNWNVLILKFNMIFCNSTNENWYSTRVTIANNINNGKGGRGGFIQTDWEGNVLSPVSYEAFRVYVI